MVPRLIIYLGLCNSGTSGALIWAMLPVVLGVSIYWPWWCCHACMVPGLRYYNRLEVIMVAYLAYDHCRGGWCIITDFDIKVKLLACLGLSFFYCWDIVE